MISDLKTWVTYISIGGILGTLERKALGSQVEEQCDVKNVYMDWGGGVKLTIRK